MDTVCKKYDVTVIGGGPAGVSCAFNCARLGLKTLLVEKNNFLGGQITGALVVPMMKSESENINLDFYNELLEYSKKYDAQITYSDGNDGWLNPVVMKIVFEKMLKDVGADILYEADILDVQTEGNVIKSGDFSLNNSKILSIHIVSEYFVDCTGNSKFSEISKCNFIDDFGKNQPSSLRFIVSNIDLEEFSKQILELDKDRSVTSACRVGGEVHLSSAYTFDTDKNWGLAPIFKRAAEAGDLKHSDTAYFQVFTLANMPNSLAFNCPRLSDCNNDDVFAHSNSLIEAREVIYRIFNFTKKYFKGFQNAFIAQIADVTGVRLSKRPKTKYIYKLSDILESKTFKTPVLAADYPVDIHSNEQNSSTLKVVKKYYLPLESLMSADFENLFVSGRNVGAEFEAQGALRIQKSCMSMGEGVAKFIKTAKSL